MDNTKNKPMINIGDFVEVIINENNKTYHCGWVYLVQWHHKDNCYYYYIFEKNHKISKRYSYTDLTVWQVEKIANDLIIVGGDFLDQNILNSVFKYNICKSELTDDQYKDSNRIVTTILTNKKEYAFLSIDGVVPGKMEDYIFDLAQKINKEILLTDLQINPYSWIMYSPKNEKYIVKLDPELFDEMEIIKYIERQKIA